eukprot:799666-Pyramimonas_sp.AAC.1
MDQPVTVRIGVHVRSSVFGLAPLRTRPWMMHAARHRRRGQYWDGEGEGENEGKWEGGVCLERMEDERKKMDRERGRKGCEERVGGVKGWVGGWEKQMHPRSEAARERWSERELTTERATERERERERKKKRDG